MNRSSQRTTVRIRKLYREVRTNVWFFPGLGAFVLIILTLLQISGTSIGIYNPILYGPTAQNTALLANHPEPVRSDEWLVMTQFTIAQKVAGFPRINPNIDGGRDMSIAADVPYKEWSVVFKPQNLIFFVLPLTYAFAFKWWLLLYLTVVSVYFLILRFFPRKHLFAAIFSTAFGCSPFIFWWYQTITVAPIFYGCFILLLGMRIINDEKVHLFKDRLAKYSTPLYALLLAYLLTSFALVLYPAFLIPVGIVVAALLLAYLLQRYGWSKELRSPSAYKAYAILATGAAIAVALILVFVDTRIGAIKTIANTIYPGNRLSASGGTPLFELFNSYLQPQLQRAAHAAHYYTNPSEASSFVLFLPFLFIPGWFLIYLKFRRTHRLNWPLLAIQLCITLFLANMFIPGLGLLDKITLLDRVPHVRMFLGLGFAGLLQLLLILKEIEDMDLLKRPLTFLAFVYSSLCLICLAVTGEYVRRSYPLFIHDIYWIAFLGVFFAVVLFCLLSRRLMLGALLLLIFSVGSVFNIHPLYRGLGPVYGNNALLQAMDQVSQPGTRWITADDLYFENFPALANRDSLSGVQPYPNLAFWQQVAGPKYRYVYNRYAHVVFNSSPSFPGTFQLIGPDMFQVKFACTPFMQKEVQYVLSTAQLDDNCVTLVRTVSYPGVLFYLYQIR